MKNSYKKYLGGSNFNEKKIWWIYWLAIHLCSCPYALGHNIISIIFFSGIAIALQSQNQFSWYGSGNTSASDFQLLIAPRLSSLWSPLLPGILQTNCDSLTSSIPKTTQEVSIKLERRARGQCVADGVLGSLIVCKCWGLSRGSGRSFCVCFLHSPRFIYCALHRRSPKDTPPPHSHTHMLLLDTPPRSQSSWVVFFLRLMIFFSLATRFIFMRVCRTAMDASPFLFSGSLLKGLVDLMFVKKILSELLYVSLFGLLSSLTRFSWFI